MAVRFRPGLRRSDRKAASFGSPPKPGGYRNKKAERSFRRPAVPASRVVWSRRRCEPPDSAVAAAIEAISRKECRDGNESASTSPSRQNNNLLVCIRHTACLYSSPGLSADQCFPPKCAHKGPTRCRLTQDSCAHRPFKGECAQQKRIPRYLWPVRRAHFDEGVRREMQPMKASCHDTD